MAQHINKKDKEVAKQVGLAKLVFATNKLAGKLCNICRLKSMSAPRKMNNINRYCEKCKPHVKAFEKKLVK